MFSWSSIGSLEGHAYACAMYRHSLLPLTHASECGLSRQKLSCQDEKSWVPYFITVNNSHSFHVHRVLVTLLISRLVRLVYMLIDCLETILFCFLSSEPIPAVRQLTLDRWMWSIVIAVDNRIIKMRIYQVLFWVSSAGIFNSPEPIGGVMFILYVSCQTSFFSALRLFYELRIFIFYKHTLVHLHNNIMKQP